MIELLLPRTDLGAAVQLGFTLGTGVPLTLWCVKRGARELTWLVAGVMTLVLGFFALRTVH